MCSSSACTLRAAENYVCHILAFSIAPELESNEQFFLDRTQHLGRPGIYFYRQMDRYPIEKKINTDNDNGTPECPLEKNASPLTP